jgi:hypothetical protein
MELTIDIDDPVPQFEQLIEQINAAVTAGVTDSEIRNAFTDAVNGRLPAK